MKKEAEYQRHVDDFVGREVYYNLSTLVHELAKSEAHQEDLFPVLFQDDYESAAYGAGWREFTDKYGVNCYRQDNEHFGTDENDSVASAAKDWETLCWENNIDPVLTDALEHWLVSDWLADNLEAAGEMIIRDFMGLTIWGRRTSGQAISIDYVICKIYNEMQNT